MGNFRKFALYNSQGTIWDLSEDMSSYANSPQGLGFTRTNTFIRLGDDAIISSSKMELLQTSFELIFYDLNPKIVYQNYEKFMRFLSFKPLYLLYQKPNSDNWYRKQVMTASMTKGEISEDGMMRCNLTLDSMSFWEDRDVNVIETDKTELGGKIYPITYPIEYGEISTSNIKIASVSMLDTPFKLTIDGKCSDPMYVLYDADGNVYGRGKFIGDFEKVVVNSEDADETIELTHNGLIIDNPYNYQDLSIGNTGAINITFLKLKQGQSKLAFILDTAFDGKVRIEWRNRYASI